MPSVSKFDKIVVELHTAITAGADVVQISKAQIGDFLEVLRDERERCALLADALATMYERKAAKLRTEGTYTTRSLWPPFRRVRVLHPNYLREAVKREDAAHVLRNSMSRGCREGWDVRKAHEKPEAEIEQRFVLPPVEC